MRRIALLVMVILGMVMGSPASAQLQQQCRDLVTPARVLAQHPERRRFVEVEQAEQIDALLQWGGDTNWQGYESGGWIIPPDRSLSMIYLYPEAYDEQNNPWGFQMIIVYSSGIYPDVVLPMVFTNMTPFADANGNHFGTHPCYAFIMPRAEFDAWISEVGGGDDW